jgi:hypothetical protein
MFAIQLRHCRPWRPGPAGKNLQNSFRPLTFKTFKTYLGRGFEGFEG